MVLNRHRWTPWCTEGPLESGSKVGSPVAKEHNVLAAMQLVAACQQAPLFRRLIVRSTGQIYGASPLDPARFAEDTAPGRPPQMAPAATPATLSRWLPGSPDGGRISP